MADNFIKQPFGLNVKVPARTIKQIEKTAGGTVNGIWEPLFNFIDENLNKIKNMMGKSRAVLISSQLGIPIAAFEGDDVYFDIPSDLPKTTRIMIDGKALYVHRVNYILLDKEIIV